MKWKGWMGMNLLLASDFDRTIIPDGPDPLSPNALDEFQKFVEKPEITTAYLTGRNLSSIEQALEEYRIPRPDILVGDVGTSIYLRASDSYVPYTPWLETFKDEWKGLTTTELHTKLLDLSYLKLQPSENQNTYKLSYYAPENFDLEKLRAEVQERLHQLGIKINITISVDHVGHFCYVDILPFSATKKTALQFLVAKFSFAQDDILYAGDSGNDLEPLTAGFKSVVVNNATPQFKEQVRDIVQQKHLEDIVYFAEGDYLGMNGNYVAGILEGLDHFNFI